MKRFTTYGRDLESAESTGASRVVKPSRAWVSRRDARFGLGRGGQGGAGSGIWRSGFQSAACPVRAGKSRAENHLSGSEPCLSVVLDGQPQRSHPAKPSAPRSLLGR